MEIKTFDEKLEVNQVHPLYKQQKENADKMRATLLASTDDSGISQRVALQKITAMRVYHQIARIIRYTELMDKLEDKLYSAIDTTIDRADVTDLETVTALLTIQEKLQKSMIESHKLLEPYLDVQDFMIIDLAQDEKSNENQSVSLMNPEDRDRVRSSAQAVLTALKEGGAIDATDK